MGLNATLFTAGRSLELFSAGIQVAGNNVANANTPHYVREDLLISSSAPYQTNGLLFGTGAQSDGIRQQIDKFLEGQIHLANADKQGAESRVKAYTQLQLVLGELTENDLSTRLNEFLGSINEVINQPELTANKQIVIQEASLFTESIQQMRAQLDQARESFNGNVASVTREANDLIQEVADLNIQIVRMESAGLLKSDAGGLRSNRLAALNRLSEIIPIRTVERSNGVVDIFSGNDYLVLQNSINLLESYRSVDQGVPVEQIRFSKTKSELTFSSGELSGLIEARDSILGGFVTQLDRYTTAVIQEFNRLHATGEGTNGYESILGSYAVTDTAAALNNAGLDFTPQHGSFEIKLFDQATQTTTTTFISIDLDGLGGNDTTLVDLQSALDAITNLSASIDPDGRLQLDAAEGYEIRFANDSANVLAALGINTFFTGKDANDIAVNTYLENDPQLLATGLGEGAADNTNAILLAQFSRNPVESLGDLSIDEFYQLVTSQIAEGANAETAVHDGFESFQTSLFGQRQQISGVSLDEEAIKIMELQHGYTAAARLISTIEELFNTLVNL